MRKKFFVLTFFCAVAFSRLELSAGSENAEVLECGALFGKYTHTQRGVVSWNGYGAYRPFLNLAEKRFIIPGLCESFVPQGITFCESINSFMLSGYSDDGGAAHIITIGFTSGRINGEHKILKSDGSDFTGHSGGITSYGRYVYIADGYTLYYIPVENFTGGSGKVTISGEIRLPVAASYISTYGGYMWAGNFYHKSFAKNYDVSVTDKYNRLHRTVIAGYRFDSSAEGAIRTDSDGIENTAVPFAALCAPNEIQGLAFLGSGDVHLSSSYGRNVMSMQRLYEYPFKRQCDTVINLLGRSVPVWFLNNDSLKRAVTSFPMSEGAVCHDGKVYIVFESAAKKYRDTATDPTDCVWEMNWN